MTISTLKGKRIVLTLDTQIAKKWAIYLRQHGAIVNQFPTIKTSLAKPTKKLEDVLTHLDNFSWIIFTSPRGPYAMRDLMKQLHIKMPIKKMPHIAAVGEKTASAIYNIGYRVNFTPSISNSTTLARELKPLRSPILLLRTNIASKKLPQILTARGAHVIDISIYKTKILREKPNLYFYKLLSEQKIDFLIFASPSAVHGFSARVKGKILKSARQITAITISPRIAKILQRIGFYNIRIAPKATIQAVTNTILNH